MLNVGGKSGVQTASVWLNTDEPSKPQITLGIAAYITFPIGVHPRQLDFGSLLPGLSNEMTLEFWADLEKQPGFHVVRVETRMMPLFIYGTLMACRPEGDLDWYAVRLLAPRSASNNTRYLKVYFSDRTEPVSIPIRAELPGSS